MNADSLLPCESCRRRGPAISMWLYGNVKFDTVSHNGDGGALCWWVSSYRSEFLFNNWDFAQIYVIMFCGKRREEGSSNKGLQLLLRRIGVTCVTECTVCSSCV
ncbi:hypothetical protein IGI04_022352 [Brassica rapa subsp. trilocularis]|uniref:Uncharacterized protein n=1 Tax=Brassica rapa subsp. trilocularis TaxID=1813537 RepID=A0ABQ7M0R6_BRACM|nr:hypothetical protein IGI04_022352 [Brassica rapa subsp. trilocularis]